MEALVSQPQPYPFRVLVRGPETRHIAVFALAHEQGRPVVEQAVSTSSEAARRAVGERAAHALQAGRYGAYQVVRTRERVAAQTAAYSLWLAFKCSKHAEDYEREQINVSSHSHTMK